MLVKPLGLVLGEADPDLAVDVLLDHVRALRAAVLVPAERADHGVDGGGELLGPVGLGEQCEELGGDGEMVVPGSARAGAAAH